MRRRCIGLDDQPLGEELRRGNDAIVAAIEFPFRRRHAPGARDQLGQMLVVGQPANDRSRARIGHAVPRELQRRQHLAVDEAGAVEQRDHEIDIGPAGHGVETVRRDDVQADVLQRGAQLVMIDRMIAVAGVAAAVPGGVLCQQHDFQALPGGIGYAQRCRHGSPPARMKNRQPVVRYADGRSAVRPARPDAHASRSAGRAADRRAIPGCGPAGTARTASRRCRNRR